MLSGIFQTTNGHLRDFRGQAVNGSVLVIDSFKKFLNIPCDQMSDYLGGTAEASGVS